MGWEGNRASASSFYVILECDVPRLSGIVHAYARSDFVVLCFVLDVGSVGLSVSSVSPFLFRPPEGRYPRHLLFPETGNVPRPNPLLHFGTWS